MHCLFVHRKMKFKMKKVHRFFDPVTTTRYTVNKNKTDNIFML